MCRTTDFLGFLPNKDRSNLKIKAFFVRFSGLNSGKTLSDSLILLVRGSKVRPDSPAFLTLHRLVNVKTKKGEVIFGSREPVRTSGAVRFEVYLGDETILKGMFSKDDIKEEEEWMLDLEFMRCFGSEAFGGGCAADVAVAVDGQKAVLCGRVEMVLEKKMNKKRKGGFKRLEVIPEEREESNDDNGHHGESVSVSDSGDDPEEGRGPDCHMMDMDLDLEGMKWAADLGILVLCLGVGYLVSKASARSLRRLSLF
ncbi:uncharacterized protein LOC8288834 [Ricinus communis]|uniref:Uncharacterized protein n=1 Tax=Ricinus communis TaxID=3988 RepID=B9RYT2_RICCO|nr:uncharacterized protein LOC8288834 [Ricinus communis]EEF43434.1 conserved hypothetical protein [Ricinus communis]|eukprot:XP_002518901.1 uncharacterized protein LOC8288834 [Ricinus communis]